MRRLWLALVAALISLTFLSGCALWPFKTVEEQLAAVYVGLEQTVKLNTDLLRKELITPDTAERNLNTLERAGSWAKNAEGALKAGRTAEAKDFIGKAKLLLKGVQSALGGL